MKSAAPVLVRDKTATTNFKNITKKARTIKKLFGKFYDTEGYLIRLKNTLKLKNLSPFYYEKAGREIMGVTTIFLLVFFFVKQGLALMAFLYFCSSFFFFEL